MILLKKKLGQHFLNDKNNEDESKYVEGLKYDFVTNIEEADFILGCTTLPGLRTSPTSPSP